MGLQSIKWAINVRIKYYSFKIMYNYLVSNIANNVCFQKTAGIPEFVRSLKCAINIL